MKALWVAAAAAAVFAGAPARADTITIRADLWCPFTCEPGSQAPGYLIDIATRVFEAAGHKVDYQFLPWPRAVSEVRAGQYTAIAGGGIADTPGFVLTKPMGDVTTTLAVRKGEKFAYSGPESLAGRRLGAVTGVISWGGGIDEYIAANKDDPDRVDLTGGEDPYGVNLRKLLAGRVDVIVDVAAVLKYLARGMDASDRIELISVLREPDVYIAFSPAVAKSPEYAALLDRGVEDLRASGALDEIMARYGLEDWEP